MVRDFGAGLTIDELIGMRAENIALLSLPNEEGFSHLKASAANLVRHDYQSYRLMELWERGETVWMGTDQFDVIQVSPSGQLNPQKD